MRIILITFVLLLISLNTYTYGQDGNWKSKVDKIELLSDSYDDVINLLGKPIGDGNRSLGEYFEVPEGRIFVGFASGQCVVTPYSNGKSIGWRVPEWTVILISFSANKPMKPSKLGINLDGFRKNPVEDVPGAFFYANENSGVSYTVNRNRKVKSIGFAPPARLKHLHCG